jgi:hypothetical protein
MHVNNIQTIKRTDMDELLKKAAPQTNTSVSQKVAEAIKQASQNAGAQVKEIITGDKDELWEKVKEQGNPLRELVENNRANESAAVQQPEDGLQRMIREAKMQTDLSMKGGSMIGADPALQSAGQKVRQISAGQAAAVPMSGQTEDKEAWEDFSYLTPQWQLKEQGATMKGGYVDPKAGTYVQTMQSDGSFVQEPYMYQADGAAIYVGRQNGVDEQELIRKAKDDTFALTGRVYRVNEDGTAPNWLSVGDQVVTAGGTYAITGYDREKGNGFHSELLDPNQTTETYQGPYNTGTYGSIIGEQNGYRDAFRGFRDTNGEYTGHGGYSINRQTGQSQFDTVSHTFDGNWTRSAIVEGVPYEMDASGNLIPMEAGSIVQDASQRYWVVGADGNMIDVTPEDPTYDPVADPEGWVGRIQREEAEKAGIIQQRAREAERDIALDPETQAKIRQMQAQVRREEAAAAEANRDLYRQYRLGQEQLGEQLVGAGLHTTGAAERAQADLNAEWIAAMNGNRQSVVDAESEAARQIEAIKLQARQEAQQKQQQEAQQKAAMLAEYGDFSGYSDLGYSPEQIAGMEMFYQQQQAQDNAYGGLSDYAMTILDVYRANPGYDVKSGLQQALDSGLISQQDYIAALQAAAGMSV